jgi:hypothetical protein
MVTTRFTVDSSRFGVRRSGFWVHRRCELRTSYFTLTNFTLQPSDFRPIRLRDFPESLPCAHGLA